MASALCWVVFLCVASLCSAGNYTTEDTFTQSDDHNATTTLSSTTTSTTLPPTTTTTTPPTTTTTTAASTSTTERPPEVMMAIACDTDTTRLEMRCETEYRIKVMENPEMSWYGENMDDSDEGCVVKGDTCKAPVSDNTDHWDLLMGECDGQMECSVEMEIFNSSLCNGALDYEQVAYWCFSKALFTTEEPAQTTMEMKNTTGGDMFTTVEELVSTDSTFSNSTSPPTDKNVKPYVWLVIISVGVIIIGACGAIVYVSWKKRRRRYDDIDVLMQDNF